MPLFSIILYYSGILVHYREKTRIENLEYYSNEKKCNSITKKAGELETDWMHYSNVEDNTYSRSPVMNTLLWAEEHSLKRKAGSKATYKIVKWYIMVVISLQLLINFDWYIVPMCLKGVTLLFGFTAVFFLCMVGFSNASFRCQIAWIILAFNKLERLQNMYYDFHNKLLIS